MLVRLGRIWNVERRAGSRDPQPGDLVVEISTFATDPDAIGWLVAHGDAPYTEDGTGEMREIWDIEPLSGRRGNGGRPMRWENAEFVALPSAIATLAMQAFPVPANLQPTTESGPSDPGSDS